MKRIIRSVFCLSLIILPSLLMAQGADDYRAGVVILKVKGEYRSVCKDNYIAIPQLNSIFQELGYQKVFRKYPYAEMPNREFNDKGHKLADITLIYELQLPVTTDVKAAVDKVKATGLLEYAEPDYVSYDMYVPNDALLNSVMPYHFSKVSAYQAWDSVQGDTNMIIGITETSIDVNHEDLRGNIRYNYADPINGIDDDNDGKIDNYAGWDMVDNDNNLFINNEIHGTAVAAIASASADNNIGYAGIGFKCKFLPVKAGNNSQVITHGYPAIGYCVQMGCKVVNCSWGNTTYSQQAQDIITYTAINNDVVVVASAGNVDATGYYYPASYQYVLSVTGVDLNDKFDNGVNANFTYNDSVDVSAPGFNVYTTATYGGNYLYSPPQGGTSMAAPIVSGIAGLVRSQFPCLDALEVIEKIKSTTDDISAITENLPYAGTIGTGRVNAYQAILGVPCVPVGEKEVTTGAFSVLVYPNPANDVLNISINGAKAGNVELQFSNTLGQQIMISQKHLGEGNNQITLNTDILAAGTYVLKIVGDGFSISRLVSVGR